MIQLESQRIVYAVTAKVKQWTTKDVCKWLNSVAGGRFKKFIPKFRQRLTNGADLLNLSRVQLQNTFHMMDPQMRSTFLEEVKLLKSATQPPRDRNGHKRKSAMSSKEFTQNRSRPGHRKSASLQMGGSLSLPPPKSDGPRSRVQRKLGPRDIGRSKGYKGTKWDRDLFRGEFLEEKIDHKNSTKAFNKRKRQNPIKHKETVDQIGTAIDYEKPKYADDVLRNANHGDYLREKPLSRRNAELDKLKGTFIMVIQWALY